MYQTTQPSTTPLITGPATTQSPITLDRQLLMDTLSVQSFSGQEGRMCSFVRRTVEAIPGCKCRFDRYGNLLITKGVSDAYPCVAAHLDTVHPLIHSFSVKRFIPKEGPEYWIGHDNELDMPSGIGGDDKVGIYIALHLLRVMPVLKVAFFSDEEIGCVGSSKIDLSFFKDCTMAIQCDRAGNADFVRKAAGQGLFGKDFQRLATRTAKAHGYRMCDDGGMTDVATLRKRGLDIPCVNLSCGYHRPHTHREYVVPEDVERCLGLVHALVAQ